MLGPEIQVAGPVELGEELGLEPPVRQEEQGPHVGAPGPEGAGLEGDGPGAP